MLLLYLTFFEYLFPDLFSSGYSFTAKTIPKSHDLTKSPDKRLVYFHGMD